MFLSLSFFFSSFFITEVVQYIIYRAASSFFSALFGWKLFPYTFHLFFLLEGWGNFLFVLVLVIVTALLFYLYIFFDYRLFAVFLFTPALSMLWSTLEWARVKTSGDDMIHLVHEATNDMEKWGPTGPQMEKVCFEFNRGGAISIKEELEYRLNHAKKSWRTCYKSLLVIDYLIRNSKEESLKLLYTLKPVLSSLSSSFYYTNSSGEDHGISVRERSKSVLELLSDPGLMQEEREKARLVKAHLNNSNRAGMYGSRGRLYDSSNYSASDPLSRNTHAARYPLRTERAPTKFESKEEQEQADNAVAMRLQREEELRSGLSAQQLEEMYARQARQRIVSQLPSTPSPAQRNEADAEYAERLQKIEDARSQREGRSLPTFRSDKAESATAHTITAASPSVVPPTQEEKSSPFQLDDLFNAGPPAGAAVQDPFSIAPQAQHLDPWRIQDPTTVHSGFPVSSLPVSSETAPSNPWGAAPAPTPASNPWSGTSPSAPAGTTPGVPPNNPWGAAPASTASNFASFDQYSSPPLSAPTAIPNSVGGDLFNAKPSELGEEKSQDKEQTEMWNYLEGFAKNKRS